jgi:hypothetical protein
MAKPEVIVREISGLEPSNDPQFLGFQLRPLTVYFGNESVANLSPDDPDFAYREKVLTDFHRVGLPVYVEVDTVSRTITTLLLPVSGKVVGLFRSPTGEIMFRLDSTPKPFGFPATHPKYPYYLHVLQEAHLDRVPVTVTATESGSEIIDIRREERPPFPAPLEFTAMPLAVPATIRPVTPNEATYLFNCVSSASCDPSDPTPSCIPFLFPDAGCEARAHEMCNLIIRAGYQPMKVWNYSLDPLHPMKVRTNNSPACKVKWYFHVAVALVVQAPGALDIQLIVLDPSLFLEDGPVPVDVWQNRQGDPKRSCVVFTSPDPYMPPGYCDVEFDPDNQKTIEELTLCRAHLEKRAGKIPFDCP